MYREKRAVSLVILTLFVYATNIYLEYNSFVLPFPIFDFILIIIALQFAFWNRKDLITFRKLYFYIYFTTLVFKLLMNPILWGFYLNEIEMEKFLDNNYLEYFKIIYTLLSIVVFICWSAVEKLKMRLPWVGIISIVQILGLFEFSYPGMYLGYVFFAGYVLYQKPTNSLSYILPLHAVLDIMALSMLTIING
ncbi:MAG: hypothetical protein ACOVQG_10510 [Crocinitomicaceae bacterium]|jgi:hypothetical protein